MVEAGPAGAAAATSSLDPGAASAAPAETASAAPSWLGTGVAVPVVPPAASTFYPMFKKTTVSVDDLTQLVAQAPELARVGKEIAFFDAADKTYLAHSSADFEDISFTAQPMLWSPSQGRQVLVVAAHGKNASFVAAWWVLPEGGYRLASSFVMIGELAPLVLAWKPGDRTLWWTSCWHCPGETGRVSVREDGHVVIVQD